MESNIIDHPATQNLREQQTMGLQEEKVDRTAANTHVTQRIEGSIVRNGVRYTLTNSSYSVTLTNITLHKVFFFSHIHVLSKFTSTTIINLNAESYSAYFLLILGRNQRN